jgi:hypothetical protein
MTGSVVIDSYCIHFKDEEQVGVKREMKNARPRLWLDRNMNL